MRHLMICLLAACSCLAASAAQHSPKTLANTCTQEFLEANLVAPMAFAPVPKYGDPFWTDSIPAQMRKSYINEAKRFKDSAWQSIDPVMFAQFRKEGDRGNYESVIFLKRRQLANLAMGELMDGKGTYLPQIIRGLHSMLEETWWGIPAHYPTEYPTADTQPLALFSAESGAMVAWIYYLYADAIKEFSPRLYDRLGQELKRRVLDEGLQKREWWRGTAMNWNPWICSNWLACVLIAEPDRDRQIQAVKEIAESIDSFIDNYPADGGCDEGPMYFDRAAGSLLDVLVLLKSATGGAIDLSDDQKVHNMASFIGAMMIDSFKFVNFADAAPGVNVRPELFAGASAINDPALMALVANQAATQQNFFNRPHEAYNADNFPTMGRELMLLPMLHELEAANQGKSLSFDAWMPNIQVLTARSVPNSTEGLYLAAKGGHNNESHNHNDVGSFIVYADGNPLLVDPGIATYTAKSFTNERYKQWNVQSLYHNTPIINGVAQHQGGDFKANDVKTDITKKRVKLSMDLAKAYPAEAKVKSWVRNLDFTRGRNIKVTEKYRLEECVQPAQIVLMAASKPQIANGKITFEGTDHGIDFNPAAIEATCEEMPITDQRMSQTWKVLYRILLTDKKPSTSGTIAYTIY